LEISIENINKRESPYQLFLDHFKNDLTREKYTKLLYRFLKLIPNRIYGDAKTEEPKDSDIETLANCFVLLAQKHPKTVRNIIAAFIEEEKKLVEKKALNPNTVPNHVKPIKVLLDANSIPIHWKFLMSFWGIMKDVTSYLSKPDDSTALSPKYIEYPTKTMETSPDTGACMFCPYQTIYDAKILDE